jgi:uncharacterized membrane protein YsdA (DUF1294 family)
MDLVSELSSMQFWGLIYFGSISLITFFYFGWDKIRSTANKRRVPEKILWILSLLGGSPGALLAMHFFRHKTKKISFQAMMAVILAVQITIVLFLLHRSY